MKIFLFLFSFLITFQVFSYDKELEEKKIDFLISKIENSKATFLRNGDKHTAKKAASHLKFKLMRAKGLFSFFSSEKVTAQTFIDKIASQSSTTGKPYFMILPDGKKVSTKDWLNGQIKGFKIQKSAP